MKTEYGEELRMAGKEYLQRENKEKVKNRYTEIQERKMDAGNKSAGRRPMGERVRNCHKAVKTNPTEKFEKEPRTRY